MLLRRIFAFFIDYVLIVGYGGLLFCLSLYFQLNFNYSIDKLSPFQGQLLGFVSLTIPVFLYSFLMESSTYRATVGKIICRIKVTAEGITENKLQLLYRNLLKYLPWEIAHTGVHWLFYFNYINSNVPVWIWIFLFLPQIIMVFYFITAIHYKGEQTYYDKLAKTKLVPVG